MSIEGIYVQFAFGFQMNIHRYVCYKWLFLAERLQSWWNNWRWNWEGKSVRQLNSDSSLKWQIESSLFIGKVSSAVLFIDEKRIILIPAHVLQSLCWTLNCETLRLDQFVNNLRNLENFNESLECLSSRELVTEFQLFSFAESN